MPHICRWYDVIGDASRATFVSLISDMEPTAPTLLIATTEVAYLQMSAQVNVNAVTLHNTTLLFLLVK